jgi:sortase A
MIALAAIILFASTIVRAVFYAPDTETTVSTQSPPPVSEADPVRLIIPAIDVDAAVQYVGVNQKGNMAVPSNYSDVGWFHLGPAPGESGSAVVAGHVNNGLGLAGVFEKLNTLTVGDDVYVTRTDGSRLHFVVTGTRSYPYNDAPTEILFNSAGSVRLNLITCDGEWVEHDKTYDERFVVFTRLAEEVN